LLEVGQQGRAAAADQAVENCGWGTWSPSQTWGSTHFATADKWTTTMVHRNAKPPTGARSRSILAQASEMPSGDVGLQTDFAINVHQSHGREPPSSSSSFLASLRSGVANPSVN